MKQPVSTKYVQRFRNMLLIVFLFLLLTGCKSLDVEKSDTRQTYSFDANTILDQIHHYKTDYSSLFIPETESITHSQLFGKTDVSWELDDYYNVAQAVHNFVWDGELSEWDLVDQLVYYNCTSIEDGAVGTDFKYSKIQDNSYHLISILIDPKSNIARTRHTEYSLGMSKWDIIDTERTITALHALEISEKAGGKDARSAVNNLCSIEVFYESKDIDSSPNLAWAVKYHSDDTGYFAKLMIDAYTGEIVSMDFDE